MRRDVAGSSSGRGTRKRFGKPSLQFEPCCCGDEFIAAADLSNDTLNPTLQSLHKHGLGNEERTSTPARCWQELPQDTHQSSFRRHGPRHPQVRAADLIDTPAAGRCGETSMRPTRHSTCRSDGQEH